MQIQMAKLLVQRICEVIVNKGLNMFYGDALYWSLFLSWFLHTDWEQIHMNAQTLFLCENMGSNC